MIAYKEQNKTYGKKKPPAQNYMFLCQHCKHFWTPLSLFWFQIFWRTMAPYWRKELPSSEGAPPSDLCFLLTTSFPDLVISCKWYNMFYFSIYPIAHVSPYTQLHLLRSHSYQKLPSAVIPWLHKIGILLPPIFPNRRLHSSDFPCNNRSEANKAITWRRFTPWHY